MKLRSLVNKAEKELKGEKEKNAVELVKNSMKRIVDCKKTLKKLEKAYKELLNSDIDDLELDSLEY